MFKPKSSFIVNNTIESLPFADLATSCDAAKEKAIETNQNIADAVEALVDEFAAKFGIKSKSWVYPQLIARVGKWTLKRSESGKFSARDLLRDNCKDHPFDKGVYYFLSSNGRFLAKQYDAAGREYCALVPLILSAHKKMNDIKYTEWDKPELLVNEKLLEAMETDYLNYTKEEIHQFRVIGLTIKSGARAGEVKSPVSTYGLNGLPKTITRNGVEMEGPGALPSLARMMVCQTWCAHPQNRSHYMILDSKNWDIVPPPLVDDILMVEDKVPTKPRRDLESVWD